MDSDKQNTQLILFDLIISTVLLASGILQDSYIIQKVGVGRLSNQLTSLRSTVNKRIM